MSRRESILIVVDILLALALLFMGVAFMRHVQGGTPDIQIESHV